MKGIALYAAISLALTAALAWAFGLVWDGTLERHAILVSAVVAFVVQLFAFAVARLVVRTNMMAGWGLGAILRLVVLGVYAIVVVDAFALPAAVALMSLAAFFFSTTLIEPLLLNV